VALNHIGLLIVDEIQNVVNSKNGKSLIGALTQLINNSGISICMVGTPESTVFFEQAMPLARRSLGLQYSALEYDRYFCDLCCTLFGYQYVKQRTEITPGVIEWLYEHSAGIVSVVVSLIHDAQEIAILNGSEVLNLDSLNEAYQKRLSLLHGYLQPSRNMPRTTVRTVTHTPIPPADKPVKHDVTIEELAAKAKAEQLNIVELLKQHMPVDEVWI